MFVLLFSVPADHDLNVLGRTKVAIAAVFWLSSRVFQTAAWPLGRGSF